MKIKKVKEIPEVGNRGKKINPTILKSVNKCINTKGIIEISNIETKSKLASLRASIRTYCIFNKKPINVYMRSPNIYLKYTGK